MWTPFEKSEVSLNHKKWEENNKKCVCVCVYIYIYIYIARSISSLNNLLNIQMIFLRT